MPAPRKTQLNEKQLIIKTLQDHLRSDKYAELPHILSKIERTVEECNQIMGDDENYSKLKHFVEITNDKLIKQQLLLKDPTYITKNTQFLPKINLIVEKFQPLDAKHIADLHKKAHQKAVELGFIADDNEIEIADEKVVEVYEM